MLKGEKYMDNIDKSIMNLVHQMENNYIQLYSNSKLCSFYEKHEQESLEDNNLHRIEKTIEDIYEHNELLNCDSCSFYHSFREQVLKTLKIKAIKDARKRIIQGRRNKYIKELLADDPIDE